MTNYDTTYIEAILNRFQTRWLRGEPRAFVDLVDDVCSLVEEKKMTQIRAARCIAGTMFVAGVDDDPLREEILIVAGDLETGHPVSTKHTWEYLVCLRNELDITIVTKVSSME